MEQVQRETTNGAGQKFVEVCLVILDVLVFLFRMVYLYVYSIFEMFFPPEETPVAGEIVLITGTGHGIGKELAKQYGELGAEVICVDVNTENNEKTASELKKLGIKAHSYTCDVTNRDKVLELGSKIQSEVGDVTILINNAGIMPCKKFLAHTAQDIKKIFDVNIFAHFWTLEAFLPNMIKKDKGHVVGISSVAGLIGSPHVAPYCASKFAVRGLMEGLGEEFRIETNHNIRFTTIYPYITDTGLCKKPVIKFKNFMKMLTPAETARFIIRAQRRGWKEATAPSYLFYTNNVTRTLPQRCARLFVDFLGAKLEEAD